MPHRNQLAVLPIQRAVAKASPSYWRDLIVVSSADGRLDAVDFDGARVELLTAFPATPGEPIAIHPIAELIAAGAEQYPGRVAA